MNELEVAQRDAVHRDVGQRQAADDRIHLAVRAERVVHADVLPGGCRAGGVGVDLIEQIPGVGAAVVLGIDLGPAQLDVHRRSGDVEGRDRAAADRLIEEHRQVLRADRPVGGQRVEDVHAELDGGGRRRDRDVVVAAGDERDVAVGIDRSRSHRARIAGERGLQFSNGGYFTDAGSERQVEVACTDGDAERFALRHARVQQVRRLVRNAFRKAEARGQGIGRERIDLEIEVGAVRVDPQLVGAAAGVDRRRDGRIEAREAVDVAHDVVERVGIGEHEVVVGGHAARRRHRDAAACRHCRRPIASRPARRRCRCPTRRQ